MSDFFFDSTEPLDIPAGNKAALYKDGNYAWEGTTGRFEAVRWITIAGDYRQCGIADCELGNPVFYPGGVRRFVRGRKAASQRARIYCDRADAPEIMNWLYDSGHGELLTYEHLYWWISTLDGKQWTAAELATDLRDNFGAPIAADRIWACQFEGGMTAPFDKSVLFGDF